MTTPRYGGPWTQQKLEILQRYLDAYTTALKKQPFVLTYVDAFAGAGSYAEARLNDYEEFQSSCDEGFGQVSRWTLIEKQFDRLVFIEKDAAQVLRSLCSLLSTRFSRTVR